MCKLLMHACFDVGMLDVRGDENEAYLSNKLVVP